MGIAEQPGSDTGASVSVHEVHSPIGRHNVAKNLVGLRRYSLLGHHGRISGGVVDTCGLRECYAVPILKGTFEHCADELTLKKLLGANIRRKKRNHTSPVGRGTLVRE